MGKIYNVILYSSQGTVSTDTRTVSYFFDWSRLPDKKYKLSFVFITSVFTATNVNVCNIFADLGQTKTFFAGSTSGAILSSGYNYLGMCRYSGTGTSQCLFADETLNAPHYLSNRPTNNQFTVSLLNNNLAQSLYTATTYPSNYTLTLCFEEMDD
jgi:hypothetical protein